ncbi:MAG: FliH/SctL family protein [Ignavibacteriales bacterium]
MIKSGNVEFRPDAIRLPVIVPVVYRAPGAGTAAQADVEKMTRSMEKMVRDAEQKAASIVERAEASAREIKEKARAAGFESGRKDGYAEGMAEAERGTAEMKAAAARALEEARGEAARIVAAAGPQIVEIAIAVARKVIKREVSADPEVVVANVREALKNVDREDAAVVRTSPVEVAVIDNVRTRLRKECGGLGEITVQEDPSVEPGGCVVVTDKGIVDARIESQVEAISERLSEVIDQRDSDGATPEAN